MWPLIIHSLYNPHSLFVGQHGLLAIALHELEQGAPDREIYGQCLCCVCCSGNIPSIEGIPFVLSRWARTFSGHLIKRSVGCAPPTHAANTWYALLHIHRGPTLKTPAQPQLQNRSLSCVQFVMMTHRRPFRRSRVTIHFVSDVGTPTSHPRFGRKASTRSGVWPSVVVPLHRIRSFIPLWWTMQLPGNVSTSFLYDTLSVPTLT